MNDLLEEHGTYALILNTDDVQTMTFGAKENKELSQNTYAYIGSAQHKNGFKRVRRHRDVATGDNNTTHWHIDYLLKEAKLTKALFAPQQDIECRTAQYLDGHRVINIGCTDCDCDTHLIGEEPTQITRQLKDVGFTASHTMTPRKP
jgi:endonuclease-3